MPFSLRSPFSRRLSLGLVALGLWGCQTPGATRIVGPDGSPMAHVHCGGDQGACFRLAGEMCPGGYEMRPVLSRNDGNFLIRCRSAVASAAAPAACAPAAPAPAMAAVTPRNGTVRSAGAASKQGWPPSSEPWPSAYPWPPPETSAVAAPAAPEQARSEPWDPGF
jgi:hypothetical protein